MIKCEFCDDEFEFQEDYDAHLRIKHPDEYHEKFIEEQIKRLTGPFMQDILRTSAQTIAAELTKTGLEHNKSPEEIFKLYNEVLSWIEGTMQRIVVEPKPMQTPIKLLIDAADVRSFVISQGITEAEIETHKKVSKAIHEWASQDLAKFKAKSKGRKDD